VSRSTEERHGAWRTGIAGLLETQSLRTTATDRTAADRTAAAIAIATSVGRATSVAIAQIHDLHYGIQRDTEMMFNRRGKLLDHKLSTYSCK